MLAFAHFSDSIITYPCDCRILSLSMKVKRTESRIEDVLTTLMPKKVLQESLALKFWLFLGDAIQFLGKSCQDQSAKQ